MSKLQRFCFATTLLGGLTGLHCGDASSHGPSESEAQDVASVIFSGAIHPQASSGLCLDVVGQGKANGTAVQVWSCTGKANQQWTYNGTTLSVYGNKCLDVTGGSTSSGTKLQIWDCVAKSTNQMWTASGATFQWKGKGKCLDLANGVGANGTRVQSSTCQGGDASQAWTEGAQLPSPQDVLIVVNDASPTSVAVGTAYAQGRGLSGIVHVSCINSAASEDNETIEFTDYQTQIEAPIRDYLQAHPNVAFIVTTRGIPIRISGATTGEAFGSGVPQASLDSYIAALDYDTLPGAVRITFNDPGGSAVGTAWLNRYWNATVPFTHAQFGGYQVTRLDGYTKQDALALATRALESERGLQPGVVLLDLEPDFGVGDKTKQPAPIPGTTIKKEDDYTAWNADMAHANDDLIAENVPVYLNDQSLMVGNMTNLLGYFSWGSNDDNFGPLASNETKSAAYNSLGFLPGAIGDTAVSTGGRSFFKQTSGQSMIADLIAQGITGVKGYTDEPLLQAVASPTIAMDRYTHGFTLAESLYAASHFVGWVDLVIGDPLTRPYPKQGSSSVR